MPTPPNGVSLDVRNFPASGDDWINTTASNGQTYSYKYTGGDANSNNGTVTCTIGNGNAAIPLTLIAANQYQIDTITFTGDDADQLTTTGSASTHRVINDQNTEILDAKYEVTVIDTGNNDVTVPCDPPIINKYPAK